MKEQVIPNNRLTVQQFRLEFDSQQAQTHKKGKVSLPSYQSEKRIYCNPEDTKPRLSYRQRKSQELQRMSQDSKQFGNLPQLPTRPRPPLLPQQKRPQDQRLHSFSSRKLNINIYHKIQKSISSKYSLKMESLTANSLKPKKLFSINNIKTDLPRASPEKAPREWHEKSGNKAFHFAIVEKHHIDRLKDQFQIPLQLQTLKCQEQEYDNHQVNLQIKNMIRFQYTQLHFKNRKQNERTENEAKIDAWEFQHPQRANYLYS